MTDIQRAMLGDHEAAARLTEQGVLIPCPICGETVPKRRYVLGDYWFECIKCGCVCGFHSSETIARKNWNTRAPILSAEEIERLEAQP